MMPWDATSGPAPAQVPPTVVERKLAERGVAPPPGYAEFAVANGGKRFASGQNYIRDKERGEPTGLSTVFHYDEAQPRYLAADIWEQNEGELDPKLVPIATTNYSGLVCLDYREGADPKVVSYDFEAVEGREITLLGDSFQDFLARIGPK